MRVGVLDSLAVRHSCGFADAVPGGVAWGVDCDRVLSCLSSRSSRKISWSTSSVALLRPSLVPEPAVRGVSAPKARLGNMAKSPFTVATDRAEGLPLVSPTNHLTEQLCSTLDPQDGQPAGVTGRHCAHKHMWTQGRVTTQARELLHMLQGAGRPNSSKKGPTSTRADTMSRHLKHRTLVW